MYLKYSADERASAHLAAARLLHLAGARQEDVALHLMRATPVFEDWASSSLHAAARSAGQKGAPVSAAGFLRRALEFRDPDDVGNARLLIDLGIMEAATGETEALTHLERALDILDDPAERALAMYALGQTLFRYGRSPEALTIFRRGADDFANYDRELSLRFEAGYLASSAYLVGGPREAFVRVASMTSGLAMDDPGMLSPAERLLVLHLAVFRAMSEPGSAQHADLALRVLGDGLQLWRETSDGMALSHTVLALTWCGAPRDAVTVADKVLTDARLRGDSLIFAEISLARGGLAMYARGRVNEAMADAQAAIIGMSRGLELHSSGTTRPPGILPPGPRRNRRSLRGTERSRKRTAGRADPYPECVVLHGPRPPPSRPKRRPGGHGRTSFRLASYWKPTVTPIPDTCYFRGDPRLRWPPISCDEPQTLKHLSTRISPWPNGSA